MDRPFWATLALRRTYIEGTQHGTMETDGERIWWEPDFVERHTVKEIEGVIAHELFHIVSLHHLRRGHRDPDRWGRACDYAINDNLLRDGFTLPEDRLHEKRFRDMSAEAIYTILQKEEEDPQKQPKPAPAWGVVLDGEPGTEKKVVSELITAVKAGKMAGDVPGFMEDMAELHMRRGTDWKKVLRRFSRKGLLTKKTWKRPNRRYVSKGIYLPGKIKHGVPELNMIVDVSGSISIPLFELFIGELEFLRKELKIKKIRVLTIDTRIINDQVFELNDPLNIELKGRGGTRLDKAFAKVEGTVPTIVFTDGEFRDPPVVPRNPVLWVIPGNPTPRSFGEIVQIKE